MLPSLCTAQGPVSLDLLHPWKLSLHPLGCLWAPAPEGAPGWHWGLCRALLLSQPFKDTKTTELGSAALKPSPGILQEFPGVPVVPPSRHSASGDVVGLCQHPGARPALGQEGCSLQGQGAFGVTRGVLGAVMGCWEQQWGAGGSRTLGAFWRHKWDFGCNDGSW